MKPRDAIEMPKSTISRCWNNLCPLLKQKYRMLVTNSGMSWVWLSYLLLSDPLISYPTKKEILWGGVAWTAM